MRDRGGASREGAERERETERETELSVQSLTWGSNSQNREIVT